MAAHRKPVSYGGSRNSKNHEYTIHHFVTFLDCCKVLLDSDQQGELPLMRELFAATYPSTAKISYPAGGFASWFVECHGSPGSQTTNQVPVKYKKSRNLRAMRTSELCKQNPPTGKIRSGSRRLQYLGSCASRMSARKYALQPNSSLFLSKSNEPDSRVKRASQVHHIKQKSNVSRIGFKDSYVASTRFSNKHSLNLDDDEFSLQHWMNFGCIRNASCENGNWDHKLPTNARKLETAEKLTSARRAASPSGDVFELTNRALRKSSLKKKRLTSSKDNKQNCHILSPMSLNSHNDFFYAHNYSSPYIHEGPVFVQQGHTDKGKKSEMHENSDNLHDFCQMQSALLVENFGRSRTVKETRRSQNMPTSLSSTSQRSQGFIEGTKKFSLDDELIISDLPGHWCSKPYQRSANRKTLPDSTRNTCGFSDLERRNYGPSTNVYVCPQRDSTSECTQKVQNLKETEAEPLQTKELTRGKDNKTSCAEASAKHAIDHAGKSASPDGLITATELRRMQLKVQEEDGFPKNPGGGGKIGVSVERTQSLSQKYRPKVLKDLIGQNLVAHALSNAILNDKVAPMYLFQGPSGTGKTSAARIFSAALNCLTSGDKKPCGLCTECTAFVSGKTSGFWELDAASHNGVVYIKELIQGKLSSTTGPRYNVIIFDECHMFSQETWSALLKLLEEPPAGNAVIILITTHPGKLPFTVVSRCQKFHFLKIKHSEIVDRLDTVMKLEKLDAEPGALNLIASRSDGSLRDAETVLDQVSLLEQPITLDTIHQLVGSVSDNKLLSLLNMALHSDTLGTVKRTRDLIDSGIEPLDLTFQLSTLITNILAGSYIPMNTHRDEGCLSMHALSDLEMERLQTALQILSEAEKQLKATSQFRTTWLTAALLHIGPSFHFKTSNSALSMTPLASSATQSISKNRKVAKKRVVEVKSEGRNRTVSMGRVSEGKSYGFDAVGTNELTRLGLESGVHSVDHSCLQRKPTVAAQFPSFNEGIDLHVKSPTDLERLWLNVLKCCRPLSLRQQLQDHGKLLAVSFSAVKVVAHLKIEKQDPKLKAGFYDMCIVNSFKKVLGLPVEVEISLPPALYSAGSTHEPATSCGQSVKQSISKLCVDCEGVELQNERAILDVKSTQSQRNESENLSATFNSTCFSPAAVAPPVTSLEFANNSSSNLLVLKQHFSETEGAMPEQHSSKGALTCEAKCPIQTAVDCCLQNLEVSHKLQFETLKDRRRLRRKPMAGLHAQKYSCDSIIASLVHGNSTQVHNHKKESLVLESQLKCGGLLCWKSQKSEAGKGIKHH